MPFDWETITRAIGNYFISPENATEADIDMIRALLHTEVKIGSGVKVINMTTLIDGHIILRILTDLPIDKNFIVHGCWQEKLSGQQSQCWHMSQTLESDCDELMLRMRRPITYSSIDCPDGYYWTDARRCPWCSSEYTAAIYRAEEEEEVCGDKEEYYPYYIQFQRFIDLGEYPQEGESEESEEFKALTAGQVCCDHLERAREPPIEYYQWEVPPPALAGGRHVNETKIAVMRRGRGN